MSTDIKKNYSRSLFGLNKFISKIIKNKRNEINKLIEKKLDYEKHKNMLDVGTTSSLVNHENQILEYFYKKIDINCLSNLDLSELKSLYPEISIHLGDGRDMLFENNKFDIVVSSATIEHVGSFEQQLKFVSECYRVSKHKTFITTPNRYYPIEFHTKIPLLHYLPKSYHRKILSLIGEKFLSLEENLNLLSKNNFFEICKILKIKNFTIEKVKLFGLVSNYILIINKT